MIQTLAGLTLCALVYRVFVHDWAAWVIDGFRDAPTLRINLRRLNDVEVEKRRALTLSARDAIIGDDPALAKRDDKWSECSARVRLRMAKGADAEQPPMYNRDDFFKKLRQKRRQQARERRRLMAARPVAVFPRKAAVAE